MSVLLSFGDKTRMAGTSPAMTNEHFNPKQWSGHGLDFIRYRRRLPADLGVLLGERDGADRRVARQHAAAVEAGQPRGGRGQYPVRDARTDDRRAAARQQYRQYRGLGAGDR